MSSTYSIYYVESADRVKDAVAKFLRSESYSAGN